MIFISQINTSKYLDIRKFAIECFVNPFTKESLKITQKMPNTKPTWNEHFKAPGPDAFGLYSAKPTLKKTDV